jgi:hypothetical protein
MSVRTCGLDMSERILGCGYTLENFNIDELLFSIGFETSCLGWEILRKV